MKGIIKDVAIVKTDSHPSKPLPAVILLIWALRHTPLLVCSLR